MTEEVAVATPYGAGRLVLARADEGCSEARATLLLSHGAGKGIDAIDLAALAAGLPTHGVSVALFEQPWVAAGRKVASAPATLDVGLQAAAASLAASRTAGPLVVGGRSAGARSAARCAAGLGAAGCLALSFPLHPPGRPERSRLDELLAGAGVPTLVLQGERDAMGRPEEFPGGLPGLRLVVRAVRRPRPRGARPRPALADRGPAAGRGREPRPGSPRPCSGITDRRRLFSSHACFAVTPGRRAAGDVRKLVPVGVRV